MKRKLSFKEIFEKWYVMLMLMRIARQNEKRQKFLEKYDYDDMEEDFEHSRLVRCTIDKKGLKEKGSSVYATDNKKQIGDYGIEEYVYQVCQYEDWYTGTIYRKTPINGLFIRTHYNC